MSTHIPTAEFLDPCFSTPFSPSVISPAADDGGIDANSFISFFDLFPLPFPVTLSFNSEEKDTCRSIGDMLRKYFSLGYRHGAIDHFLKQCEVTQVGNDKFVFSGIGDHALPSSINTTTTSPNK